MENRTNAVIKHLQAVHSHQRTLIQQLQAENARKLSDLADVRRERDTFRGEAARYRKSLADLQNRFEEVMSEYYDLKRDRRSLSRSMSGSTKTVDSANEIPEGPEAEELVDQLQELDSFLAFGTTTLPSMRGGSFSEAQNTSERRQKVMGARKPLPRVLPDHTKPSSAA